MTIKIPVVYNEIQEKLQAAAALLVEAALLQASHQFPEPAESAEAEAAFLEGLLTEGEAFLDDKFEQSFWEEVAAQVELRVYGD